MQHRTVWIVLRPNIAQLPPVLSVLRALLANGSIDVRYVGTSSSNLPLDSKRFLEYVYAGPRKATQLAKAYGYFGFRRFVSRTLKNAGGEDLVWYASLDTALALLGTTLFEKHAYILQLHELYDQHPLRLRLAKKIAKAAKHVVVPEANRAAILQVWLGLREKPIVLPNKPHNHPRMRRLPPTTLQTQRIVDQNRTSKHVLLYQGHLSRDRNLLPLAYAVKNLEAVELWLMGKDHGCVSELIDVSPNIKYLGHVEPPYHLEITSYADVGVMCYDPVSLNNVFCAPNKIWEYSGFGIPFLANDCAGLSTIAQRYRAGKISHFDPIELERQIRTLISEATLYREDADRFFDSVDLNAIVESIVH